MSNTFNLPPQALSQHIAVLGKTGSGKTFAVKGAIVEPLLEEGRRVGIVDPTGAWWGLRSSSDGKGPGFPILVLGGDHGDLPLPALGGAAVARLLAEQGVNLVADTTQLTVGERTRWFIDFATALYRLNKSPLHLVLDEAHNFAPKGKIPDPDTGKMLHAANTLASGGRSRGIRLALITQRPQKLHNDTLTSADTLVAMRVLAPHDRLAVEDWIKGCGDLAAGKEVLNSLASLQRGEGWVWYPEGNFLQRGRFPSIRTFDSSATPTDGHAIAAPKRAAEINLTEIRSALADAVKEAEANDPKLLQRRIADLERQIKRGAPPARADDAGPMVAALRQELEAVTRSRDGLQLVLNGWHDRARRVAKMMLEGVGDVALGTNSPEKLSTAVVRHEVRTSAAKPAAAPAPAGTVEGLRAGAVRILQELAARSPAGYSRPQVGALTQFSHKGGTFGTYFSDLRRAGFIEERGGLVFATEAGIRALGDQVPATPKTHAEVMAMWRRALRSGAFAMLEAIVEAGGAGLKREAIAAAVGMVASGGTFGTYLSDLRRNGLITERDKRCIANDILFPKGGR